MVKGNEFIMSTDGENVLLNVPYAEAYIPYDIIGDPQKGNPVAYRYGDGFRTIGLFNIRFYNSDQDDRASSPLRTFKYPNVITTYPSDSGEVSTLQLDPNMEPDKYCILKYYEGDVIMSVASASQMSSKSCEVYMNQLIMGKLPKGINYMDMYFSWVKNFQINGQNPGVPFVTLQMIVAANCRYAKDPSIEFRKVVNNPDVKMTDYEVHNMVDIASASSVFNALTFERYGDMLTSSLNMSKQDKKQITTPLEEVLYM